MGAVNVVLGTHSWGTQERWRATPAPMPLEMTPPKSCPPRTPRFAPSPFLLFRTFSWWGSAGAQPRWEVRHRAAVPSLGAPCPGAGPASLGRPTTRWAGAPVRPGSSARAWAPGPGPEAYPLEAEPALGVLPALHFRRRGGFGLGNTFCSTGFLSCLPSSVHPPHPPQKWRCLGPSPHRSPALGLVSGLGPAG